MGKVDSPTLGERAEWCQKQREEIAKAKLAKVSDNISPKSKEIANDYRRP